jgi:hypothetical protein
VGAVVAPDREPVRIVPLHGVDELAAPAHGAAPAAAPQLVYNGGLLLTAVEVVTIFWGAWWETADGAPLVGEVNGFFDFVVTSELLDQLSEYNAGGLTIGHGSRIATATLTDVTPATAVDDATLRLLLQDAVARGTVPAPTANTLYFLYLPPNTAVVQGGSRSCQAFCGYHDAIDGELFYAVMPYPGCAGCAGGLALLDALTTTSSHELCEAITDPVPGAGWYDEANGEIGDICAWQTRPLGAYTVQLEWSNAQQACV